MNKKIQLAIEYSNLEYSHMEYYYNVMKKEIFSKEHKVIVKRLKFARKDSGLTQSEVAEKLTTTQSYISKIESGQVRIDVIMLDKLSQIYEKEINYFIK